MLSWLRLIWIIHISKGELILEVKIFGSFFSWVWIEIFRLRLDSPQVLISFVWYSLLIRGKYAIDMHCGYWDIIISHLVLMWLSSITNLLNTLVILWGREVELPSALILFVVWVRNVVKLSLNHIPVKCGWVLVAMLSLIDIRVFITPTFLRVMLLLWTKDDLSLRRQQKFVLIALFF